MQKMMGILTALAFGIGLTACDQLGGQDTPAPAIPTENSNTETTDAAATVPEPVTRPTVSENTAEIDWTAARDDLAAIPSEDRDGSFQVASGSDAPPVPVLLPTGIVMPAGAEDQVKFQPLSDGYFASYPGVAYDIIVNGTNEVMGDGARGEEEDRKERYLATSSGAQVAFSRYGADYLVEFECNDVDGESATCLSEEDAVEIARKLVIAGTR